MFNPKPLHPFEKFYLYEEVMGAYYWLQVWLFIHALLRNQNE